MQVIADRQAEVGSVEADEVDLTDHGVVDAEATTMVAGADTMTVTAAAHLVRSSQHHS